MVRNPFKVPCFPLNRLLTVTNFTKTQVNSFVKNVKKIIKDPKVSFDVIQYYFLVIQNCLSKEDYLHFESKLKNIDDQSKPYFVQAIYDLMVSLYPDFSLDIICDNLNGNPNLEDQLRDLPTFISGINPMAAAKKEIKRDPKKKDKITVEHLQALQKVFEDNIKGQSQAIESIISSLALQAVGFSKHISLFFIGPTGVGKSEISKILGEKFVGNFFRIDCNELGSSHEYSKFLGSPPGYIGYTEKPLIQEKAAKSNKWVFLFDEIEKASPKFFNIILNLIDTGLITDNTGATLDFTESIFIFTSNCGVTDIKRKNVGFGELKQTTDTTKETLQSALERTFTPEFRNRIDEFVYFNPITPDIAREIVKKKLKQYPINITEDLVDYVSKNGFSEEFGARQLNRFIKKNIALPLANSILNRKYPKDKSSRYTIQVQDSKLNFC
jgi:ATP-dependent Clp protease ATP-binding subunit ClpA